MHGINPWIIIVSLILSLGLSIWALIIANVNLSGLVFDSEKVLDFAGLLFTIVVFLVKWILFGVIVQGVVVNGIEDGHEIFGAAWSGQHELKNGNPEGRNVRLDIHAALDNGEEFDVEVQRRDDGADYHRARFNSSMLDARMLKSNDEFETLKDSYVIFITEHDVPGKGFALYHVERIIRETGEVFDDGSHIIYVNGEYTGNDEIGNLIHDFHCVKADDIYNPELANSIRHYKEEGENNMCSSVKAYGDEREARGIAIGEARAAETAKKYQNALAERDAENARLRAELEKYKSAEKRNWIGENNTCSSVEAYGDEREARGIAIGEDWSKVRSSKKRKNGAEFSAAPVFRFSQEEKQGRLSGLPFSLFHFSKHGKSTDKNDNNRPFLWTFYFCHFCQ